MDRDDSGRQNSVNHLIEKPDQLRAENIVDELADLCAAVEAERAAAVAYIDDWASTLNTRAAHISPSDVRRIARGIEAGEHKAEKKED